MGVASALWNIETLNFFKAPCVWVCKLSVVVCTNFKIFHFPGLGALRCGVDALKTSKFLVCGSISY